MSGRLLYWFTDSGPSWRTMAVMTEKNLTYESRMLNEARGEHKSPEVLAINPRGQVPTFRDGQIIINESMAIMQYIEEVYPEPPLLPCDRAHRALAYQRMHEAAVLYDSIQPLFYSKMVGHVDTDFDKEQFQQGVEKAHKELAFFEGYLSDGREFLAGDVFTLADINLAVTLYFAQRGGAALPRYSRLRAYAERLSRRPCFHDNHPSNWSDLGAVDWLADL